jgi:hypothetical protein
MPKTQPKDLHEDLHAIDRRILRNIMWENRITQDSVAKRIKPRVTQRAVSKALREGSRFLLPKIESVVNKILAGK